MRTQGAYPLNVALFLPLLNGSTWRQNTLHVTRRKPSFITVVLDSDKDLPKAPQQMREFPLD